jgi:hypothetical protein
MLEPKLAVRPSSPTLVAIYHRNTVWTEHEFPSYNQAYQYAKSVTNQEVTFSSKALRVYIRWKGLDGKVREKRVYRPRKSFGPSYPVRDVDGKLIHDYSSVTVLQAPEKPSLFTLITYFKTLPSPIAYAEAHSYLESVGFIPDEIPSQIEMLNGPGVIQILPQE